MRGVEGGRRKVGWGRGLDQRGVGRSGRGVEEGLEIVFDVGDGVPLR
jgi:hypothetical protein